MAALSPLLRSFDLGCGHPGAVQEGVFRSLLKAGRDTAFGNEHGFGEIRDYREFVRRVPVREYNQFAPYIERLRRGENYVLWNQKVRWFAKSSGVHPGDSGQSVRLSLQGIQDHACDLYPQVSGLAPVQRQGPYPRRQRQGGRTVRRRGQKRGSLGYSLEQQPVRGGNCANAIAEDSRT